MVRRPAESLAANFRPGVRANLAVNLAVNVAVNVAVNLVVNLVVKLAANLYVMQRWHLPVTTPSAGGSRLKKRPS